MSEPLYLSRLMLNPRSRRVQQEMANAYELHRTVMAALADGCRQKGERVLYRADPAPGDTAIALLVQSPAKPDWGFLEIEAGARGYLAEGWGENPAVKVFTPQFHSGQVLAFRLRANPTIKRAGKRLGLYREEEQLAWLQRKGEAAGFVTLHVRAWQEDQLRGTIRRPELVQQIQFVAVRFDGYLQVHDPERLAVAAANGIGSGKGFGFGLLSLARAQ